MKSIRVYLIQLVIFVLTKRISLKKSQMEKITLSTGMVFPKIMMSDMALKHGVKWDCAQGKEARALQMLPGGHALVLRAVGLKIVANVTMDWNL